VLSYQANIIRSVDQIFTLQESDFVQDSQANKSATNESSVYSTMKVAAKASLLTGWGPQSISNLLKEIKLKKTVSLHR
jgi:NAD-dependent DNA ligase